MHGHLVSDNMYHKEIIRCPIYTERVNVMTEVTGNKVFNNLH